MSRLLLGTLAGVVYGAPSGGIHAEHTRAYFDSLTPMNSLHRILVIATAPALLFSSAERVTAQPSTVILVRHAEKALEPANDPLLSEAGTRRALDLAAALTGARVGSVITTQFERTQATGRPVAKSIGQTPIVVRAGGGVPAHAEAVAAAVKARPTGEVVLVVGHSNTVPAIIAALGGPKLPDLCDGQYSALFVLEFPSTGPARLIQAKYGSPDPENSWDCARTMR